jgi:hypothetical protein
VTSRTTDARCIEGIKRGAHTLARHGNGSGALLGLSQMLRAPVIGLQPAKAQPVLVEDGLCQISRSTARRHPAAPGTGIYLHQHAKRRTSRPRRMRIGGNLCCIIGTHGHRGAGGKCCQTAHLGLAHDLVGDQHVRDTAIDQHFGLRHLLAALAHGTARGLRKGHVRALVGLGMGAQAHAGGLRIRRHGIEIALEGIQVDDQRRRVDSRHRIAGPGGHGAGHGRASGVS